MINIAGDILCIDSEIMCLFDRLVGISLGVIAGDILCIDSDIMCFI